MGKEIERKYLLDAFPAEELQGEGITVQSTQTIYQTYLAYAGKEEIRVRMIENEQGERTYTHTFKSGHGMVREEIEYAISGEIYEQLLRNANLTPLMKVRTTVDYQGTILEIDDYKQVELTVVEVEFPDLAAADYFMAPAWFGRELGAEDEYRNKTLWLKMQHGNN
ncbi:CYTH domain-containing protein [Paenibacillus phyllosphaerae]|uniref:CYTH domain-containing protein n=1 Tax=Paenibacillus phyllosphaerae TaxID=274593 RepID=A0A7W5B087_9BACL|nr:CYTH domain-containing protein [Paenibacillus phyllosphaerae]MBB3111887.1 CYTH domain-containing protein [Paenibacillus phyllosphaerae]